MSAIPFTLSGDFIELFKLLKVCGLCETGGAAKHAVLQRLVMVDGQVETRKGCKIRKNQRVEYAGQTILVQ